MLRVSYATIASTILPHWVRYTGARYWIPGMITVGRDEDGAQLVVARARHHGDTLPAKGKPEHGVAYVAYGGAEVMKHDFEVNK
ncbi:hypothetical protein PV326_008671 [Microctonus aethiopoides]|nr:hypothetical protein PV326_008671 [Microctonus aethiopoides]